MMGQRQQEQVQRGCAVGTVVLLAWLCRVLPLEGLPSGLREACGILRSLLYLSLFAGWGISLYNRTVHPQVRRLLLNVDLLMLFWILVRTLRFQLNTPPGMDRMLGYLYYAPMLGIPVLCVQLVLTVDRSERYRLSAWARMLWLPSAVLLELVLTNDLHQLQQHRYVPSAELRYALEESISSLELVGVECAMEVTHGVRLPAEAAAACYSRFESVVEGALGQLDALFVRAIWKDQRLNLYLSVETGADLKAACPAAVQEAPGSWVLNDHFEGGAPECGTN